MVMVMVLVLMMVLLLVLLLLKRKIRDPIRCLDPPLLTLFLNEDLTTLKTLLMLPIKKFKT